MTYVDSPRERLVIAAGRLLAERPTVEPTSRDLCEAAGVTAPTLYHHFGDKEGLIEAVLDEAFDRYLRHKQAVARSGDAVADFVAGWDMHIRFGLENPVLYSVMYGTSPTRRARAAVVAEAELLDEMMRLDARGLLRMTPEQGAAMTVAASVGCVMQLLRGGGDAGGALSHAMRDSLVRALTGLSSTTGDIPSVSRQLLAALGDDATSLQPAEVALLRQWLTTLAAPA